MNYCLLFIPVISALLGWLGSRIAGQLLIHRVIAARKNELAEKIGATIQAEFSFSAIEKKIADPENIKKIMPLVESHIDDFLRHKLKEKMPMVGLLIGDKTINSLKEVFLKEIEDLFPVVLKQFAGNLQTDLNIGEMAAAKIKTVSPTQLKNIFSPILNYYCIVGAITGFTLGVLNVFIFLILS